MDGVGMTRDVTPIPKLGPKPKKPRKARKPKSAKARADELWGAVIHLRYDRCCWCGRTDGKLDAHHVMIRNYNSTRAVTENGILLCFRCHVPKAHGDPAAAFKFYTEWFGAEAYAALRQRAYDGEGKRYPESFWRERVAALELELAQVGLGVYEQTPKEPA